MSLSGTLRALSRLFEHWESERWDVVTVTEGGDALLSEDEMRIEVELQAPLCAAVDVSEERSAVEMASDGTVRIDLAARTGLLPNGPSAKAFNVDVTDVRLTRSTDLAVSLSVETSTSELHHESSVPNDEPVGDNPLQSRAGRSDCQDRRDKRSAAERSPPTNVPRPAQSASVPAVEATESTGCMDIDDSADSADSEQTNESGKPNRSEEPHESSIERVDTTVPPFEDIEYLEAVYRTYDTFAEMADVIDMDVTAETVRRYMIDAEVHEPARYSTTSSDRDDASDDHTIDTTVGGTANVINGEPSDETQNTTATDSFDEVDSKTSEIEPADSDPSGVGAGPASPTEPEAATEDTEERVLIADGIGLPNDVSVEEFIDIVARSKTLYDVQRQLDVERGEAHELLDKHNLLDLVMGQLTMESHRNVTRDEIIGRLQEASV